MKQNKKIKWNDVADASSLRLSSLNDCQIKVSHPIIQHAKVQIVIGR